MAPTAARTLATIGAACAISTGGLTATASADGSGGGALPPLRGVQILPAHYAWPKQDIERELDAAKQLGANTIRVEINWGVLEPTRRNSLKTSYRQSLDEIFVAARERKLKVIAMLWASPCWASSAPRSRKKHCGANSPAHKLPWLGEPHKHAPLNPADYARIAGWVTRRYSASLAAIEIWNEPDLPGSHYFIARDEARQYARLVRAAHTAIKRESRQVQVLLSLSQSSGGFLQRLYDQGIRSSYDGIAVHFFGKVLASLRSVRRVQRRHGDRRPVWLTEFGWPTCKPCAGLVRKTGVSEDRQAANIAQTYAALRGRSWLRAALVYNLRDGEDYPLTFGLLRPDFTQKSGFDLIAQALAGKTPAVAPVTLGFDRAGGNLVAHGTTPPGDDVQLLATPLRSSQQAQQRTILSPNRAAGFRWRLPRELASGLWRIDVTHEWTGKSARGYVGPPLAVRRLVGGRLLSDSGKLTIVRVGGRQVAAAALDR